MSFIDGMQDAVFTPAECPLHPSKDKIRHIPTCPSACRPNVPAAVDTVMAALTAAHPFPDVGPGVNALQAAGLRISVMTNGSAALAKAVLARAGVGPGALGPLMDINMAVAWKPAPAAYQFAVEKLKLQPYEVSANRWRERQERMRGWCV